MFSAGIAGYNVTRGLLGALKRRAPREALVDELLDAPDTASCIARLRTIPFLEETEVGDNAAEIERALLGTCATFARKVRVFLGGSAGRFIETYMQRYEIHNAKVIFRTVLEGDSQAAPVVYPLSSRYTAAAIGALKNPGDVLDFYEDTPAGEILREGYEVYSANDSDLSLFELALDCSYIRLLWAAGEKVGAGDGARLRNMILSPWLGVTAILWALWLADYREMSVEEVTGMLALPEGLIRPEVIMTMADKRDPAAVAAVVGRLELKEFFSREGLGKDPVEIAALVRKFIYRVTSPRRLGTRFDVSKLVTALLRWELIVEDLITVAGGKAVGMGADEITPLLASRAA